MRPTFNNGASMPSATISMALSALAGEILTSLSPGRTVSPTPVSAILTTVPSMGAIMRLATRRCSAFDMALETIGSERQQKTELLHNVEELKRTEQALQASREQLEIRIKGLKDDLSKANAMVQQEKSERQGLERQLFDAQKMEAIGRITSGLANEFSHLFSVIGKQTGVVLSHLLPEDPLYGPVDEIFRTGEQAAALTAQLAMLDLEHRQFRHVISMRTIIEDLSPVLRGLLPERIQCQIAVEPGPLDVEVDREGIEQVLLNLAVNARDAMPQGGRLTIGVSPVHSTAEGRPSLANQGRTSSVRIEVSDTGSGMKSYPILMNSGPRENLISRATFGQRSDEEQIRPDQA